ncbi:MAG: LysM peptidoglycan-binding domain-containing protein, partial [Lactobacillus amylovorus]
DTLTSIAQKHGLTVDQLAKLNNLKDTSNVNIGQTLKLK